MKPSKPKSAKWFADLVKKKSKPVVGFESDELGKIVSKVPTKYAPPPGMFQGAATKHKLAKATAAAYAQLKIQHYALAANYGASAATLAQLTEKYANYRKPIECSCPEEKVLWETILEAVEKATCDGDDNTEAANHAIRRIRMKLPDLFKKNRKTQAGTGSKGRRLLV